VVVFRKIRSAWGIAQAYLRGWRTRRQIVVIESDDWGGIRTADRQAYDRLVAAGYALDAMPYGVDALETDEDLERLFDVLQGVGDSRGRPACLTANMIMANPDFERIRESGFTRYAYEPSHVTLSRRPERRGVTERWAEGLRREVFVPQLHGREHGQWWRWMAALKEGIEEERLPFELGMCSAPLPAPKEGERFFRPVYLDDETLAREGVDIEAMVREGAALFKKQFGYTSLSAIAPNCCWTDHVERLWADLGVRYIQGEVFQRIGSKARRRPHFIGERGAAGGIYLIRNCCFEPTERPDGNEVSRCLRQMARAFRLGKPAIIESHRVHYIGAVSPANRDRGLGALRELLGTVRRRWPDVIFMSSPELGRLVAFDNDDVDRADETAILGGAAGPGRCSCA